MFHSGMYRCHYFRKLYLVDNSSQKNSLKELEQEYPEVTYLNPGKNLGFGAGHNYVRSMLDSKFHAIVNPDIILTQDSLSILMDFMERMECKMAVPRMTDEKGTLQAAYRRELTVLDMGIRMFLPFCFRKRQAYHTMQDMDYQNHFRCPLPRAAFWLSAPNYFSKSAGLTSVILCIWRMRIYAGR